MAGWISIHRKIQEHWVWDEKPFDKRSAWIDLILSANFKDNKFLLGNELLEIKRGSFVTSELKLMNKWGWSKTKVRNFLDLLERDNMLIREVDTRKTTLTIVRYNDYQDAETTKEPPKDRGKTTERPQEDREETEENNEKETTPTIDTYNDCQDIETTKEPQGDHKETTERPREDTNNNDNKENKDNKGNKGKASTTEIFSELTRTFQNNGFGLLTPDTHSILVSLTKDYSDEWVLDALKVAVKRNKRNVGYVEGILKSWKAEGKDDNAKQTTRDNESYDKDESNWAERAGLQSF